jgi:hypothetical protein
MYGKELNMKIKHLLIGSLVALVLVVSISVFAQVNRPYRNGTVWNIAYIRIKPGMDSAYLNYLAGPWKANQEASKKEGIILSYKVLTVEGHTPGEFNLMLMTEYKDLATLEGSQDKADALAQKMIGTDEKQMQGYKDRSEIREVMGNRLARELVLEPKGK